MPGPFTLAQIASRLGGRIAGDSQTLIRQVGSLERGERGQIAFLSNPKYRSRLAGTAASAVILAADAEALTALPRIVCDNPYAYFARVSQLFNPRTTQPEGIHASASVAPGARLAARLSIGAGCVVGAGCYIGEGVMLGAGSRLYPNVTIYHDCLIGERAILHSGVVIGADGFGIAMNDDDRWLKVPQIGRVVIGNDVEIGANTTVDRGALDDTVIEEGVKLDNQIQIAHNVRIGAHTAIAACAGVAGSAKIGRYCRIGGAAGIVGHLTIADHVEISTFTLVTKSINKPGTYTGAYVFEPHGEWRRNAVQLRHLAKLADRVSALEKRGTQPKRSKT